jgi:hypothetical protein
MTPQKANNHTTENLLESEGDKFSAADLSRMTI